MQILFFTIVSAVDTLALYHPIKESFILAVGTTDLQARRFKKGLHMNAFLFVDHAFLIPLCGQEGDEVGELAHF